MPYLWHKPGMKILELCLSPDLGGLELYAYRTTLELRKRSLSVDLFVSPDSKLLERAATDNQPFAIFRKRGRSLPLIASRKLAQYIDLHGIDIVHVHWAKDIALAVFAKKWVKRPVRIVYTRQMEILGPKKDFYHNFIYKNVDLLLTITDRLRNQALNFTNMTADSVVRLYYGVEIPQTSNDKHCQKFRADHGIDPDAFVVGVVGRIEQFKGQHLLIDALDDLVKKGMNVHGVIVGSAMDEGYLSTLKQQVLDGKAGGNISFLGFQTNPAQTIACFDTLALTTGLETFGLVLIEAMYAGIPVIGTNAGGVPEIIDDNLTGLLFPPDDFLALAEKIRLYIENPDLRKRCAEMGQTKAREKFSSERHYSDLIKLLQNTLH